MDIEGFAEHDILVLVDNASNHQKPTRQNLVDALSRLAKQSHEGDVVVVYYAGRMGRGGRHSDKSSTKNIQAPAMVPLDAERGAGPILSDDCTCMSCVTVENVRLSSSQKKPALLYTQFGACLSSPCVRV
jgi:Caspase domain